MVQLLQALRIGVVNLFGITVPGFLILLFAVVGFMVPVLNIVFHISPFNWDILHSYYQQNSFVTLIITVIISYVAGYILRLSTPDDLDAVSAKKVLKTMDSKEKNVWPFTTEKGDKFPYFNFRAYLEARDLGHLLDHVKWGSDKKSSNVTTKRSKTAVNVMKLDIMQKSPELSAVVESNEAHIRLMSGTWSAIRSTIGLVLTGILLSLIFVMLSLINSKFRILGLEFATEGNTFPYLFALIITSTLLGAMLWAKYRIESLFHYRRVGELLFIVQAAHLVRHEQKNDAVADEKTLNEEKLSREK